MKKFYISIIAIIFTGSLFAQQIPVDNQYLVNKFSLSPAYAGYTGNFESFVSYRNSWIDIPGAPIRKSINVNGPLFRGMGIGGTITNESAGIFNTVSATANYSYHLKLSKQQGLFFGAYAGIFENHLAMNSTNSQPELDPVIADNQALRGSVFDIGIGILYRYQNLNAGIVVPRLIESSVKNGAAGDNVLYTLKRHYKVHLSYAYDITPDFQVEPFVIVSTTQNSPLQYEAAALIKYKQMAWIAASYKKNAIGASVGAVYNRFAMNYTYEFSGSGIMGYSSGSHEITIGMLIGKNKSTSEQQSVFKLDGAQPYHQMITK